MSKKTKSLAELFREAAASLAFEVDSAKLDFTDEMLALMEAQKVSRSELAARLGVKPARITALLRGDNNFTLETMIRICRALGVKYSHHVGAPGSKTHWFDVKSHGGQPLPAFEARSAVTQSTVVSFPDFRSAESGVFPETANPDDLRELPLAS